MKSWSDASVSSRYEPGGDPGGRGGRRGGDPGGRGGRGGGDLEGGGGVGDLGDAPPKDDPSDGTGVCRPGGVENGVEVLPMDPSDDRDDSDSDQ